MAKRTEYFRTAQARWRTNNPKRWQDWSKAYRASGRARDLHLQRTFGITLSQWLKLFEKQGKCCAICRTGDPGPKLWQTDHDHITGRLRGILCPACNRGLGQFKDSPEFLSAAIDYIYDW